MALCVSLLGCLFLANALNNAHAQPLEESVFRQLSAEDLQNISLRQSPEILDFAARTGETVTIRITGPMQGAIVQEGVRTIMDCGPWLRNFPGGIVSWIMYSYVDLDHQILSDMANPLINPDPLRATITGDYDEILTLVRTVIVQGAEDASRGVYQCRVCVGEGPFEVCHQANTTLAVAGRPPILDDATGRGGYSMCVCMRCLEILQVALGSFCKRHTKLSLRET